MSNAFHVPDNSKNVISVSKLRAADNEVLFGKDLEIRTKNGTLFPSGEHGSRLLWKTGNSKGSKNCSLASGDRQGLVHKRLGHNNFEVLLVSA